MLEGREVTLMIAGFIEPHSGYLYKVIILKGDRFN